MLITALFTRNTGQPATGLALTDVDLYLSRRNTSTGIVDAVWSGVNPTEEIGGGLYSRNYSGEDVSTYDYFAYAEYTGATTLDSNYSLQAGPSSVIVSDIDGDSGNKIADHTIRRSFATAAASSNGDTKSFRSLLGAIAKLVNRIAVAGNTLTTYEADDTTSLGEQTVTSDSGAQPIVEIDTD